MKNKKDIIYCSRSTALFFFICVITYSKSFGIDINPASFSEEILNSISDNEHVIFAPGNYPMDKSLSDAFGKAGMNGITFENTGTTPALFYSNTNETMFISFNNINSLILRNLSFNNVQITIRASENVLVTNCFMEGMSTLPTNKADHNLILFNTCISSTIKNCNLKWTNPSQNGKGIKFWRGSDNKCIDNNITGLLRGGIDNAESSNFLIEGGFISRDTAIGDEDHGIYIHDITNGTVKNIHIQNFTPTSSGGSLKLKNVDNIEVNNNNFYGSGILLRIEKEVSTYRLEHIWIHNNFMETTADINSWTPDYSPLAILIENNCLKDGHISISSAISSTINALNNFTNTEGGIYNNKYTSDLFLSDYDINTSGNTLGTLESPIDCSANSLSLELIHRDRTENPTVKIYPNPSSHIINIEINEKEQEIFKIYNMLGQDVTNLTERILNSSTKISIGISNLIAGVYYVKTKKHRWKVNKK